jgi:hypothetical protein
MWAMEKGRKKPFRLELKSEGRRIAPCPILRVFTVPPNL